MWYGQYLVYRKDRQGKEVRRQRNVALCPKANTPKWKAEQMLKEIILKETEGAGPTPTLPPDDSVTFRWFVKERYIPMRRGSWSPAYKKTNTYNLEHYLIEHFGDLPLRNLNTFEIQVWLNTLVEEKDYSESVVRSCFSNIRAITHLARKQKFLVDDPGEDVTMPLTKPVEKPVMSLEQTLSLLGAITDLHDLCLMHVGIFSGPRASEVMGFQWKSWTGVSLMPHGTAYEGKFYKGRLKSKASRAPIAVPEPVRPVIEVWRRMCPDPSPEALMFPTFGRGERKGEAVPREAKNFLNVADPASDLPQKLGIPDRSQGDDLPGDAAVPGNAPAEPRNLEGHPGCATPRQHYDDRQRVRTGGRGERDAGRQLSRHGCTGWLDSGGRGSRAEGTQYQKRAGGNETTRGSIAI